MKTAAKFGLLVLVAVSFAACPFVASAGEESKGVDTLFRALVGKPVTAETGPAHVLVVPGPFVFLGKSPEQDARDVLQLMERLKAGYGLAEVTIGATSFQSLKPQEEFEVPMQGGDVGVRVSLLDFDTTKAAYRVTLTKRGEQPTATTVVVNRGERGLIGTHDGSEAPYLFLDVEPLEPYTKLSSAPPAVMPKLIHRVQPVYPEDARKACVDGVVILQATVGTDGAVHDLKAFRSEPMGLTEAALAAVKQWRYAPASDAAGKPIEAKLYVTVSFMLDRSKPAKAK